MSIQNHDCKIYIIVTRSYLSRSLSSDFRVWDKGKTSHAIKLLTKLVYWMISFSLIYNLYRLTINNKQTNKQTNKMTVVYHHSKFILFFPYWTNLLEECRQEILTQLLHFDTPYILKTVRVIQNLFAYYIKKNLINYLKKTRGSVGWACVAHLSFCFEET